MLTDILIYAPFLLIALVDFSIFSSGVKVDEEPEFWTKRNRRGADTALAAMREDLGYAAG